MGASVAPAPLFRGVSANDIRNCQERFPGKRGRGRPIDFPAQKGNNPRVSLVFLAAVNVIIWTGLFVYLWRLDRRISARERER